VTFDLPTPKPYHFQDILCVYVPVFTCIVSQVKLDWIGYTKVIPYTKFEHLGIICAADKHTDRLTRKPYQRRPT